MRSDIQKGKGIDGLIGSTSILEETRVLETTGNDISKVLEKFKENVFDDEWRCVPHDIVPEILSPAEINAFLQTTVIYEDAINYYFNTGQFIAVLIQNSYDAGHNNFTLNIPRMIDNVCLNISGYRKPIKVKIYGDTGHDLGRGASCTSIELYGKTGHRFGINAKYATLTIHGELTKNSFCGLGAKKSRFKTDNEETLREMRTSVNKGNRIIQIHANGKEEVVRDYAS